MGTADLIECEPCVQIGNDFPSSVSHDCWPRLVKLTRIGHQTGPSDLPFVIAGTNETGVLVIKLDFYCYRDHRDCK